MTLLGANGLNMNYNGITAFTGNATQVGPLPTGIDKVGNGVVFFPGVTQIADPQVAGIASGAANGNLQSLSTLKAIAINGQTSLINAAPGSVGELSYGSLNGPGGWQINFNLLKRIRITERFNLEFRGTAENLTNTPIFSPLSSTTANITNATFGHITTDANGPRIIVAQLRLNF
jgi:hypothetical protein